MNLIYFIHLTKKGVKGIETIEHCLRHDNPFPVIDFNQAEINKQIDDVTNSVFEEVERWVKKGSGSVIDRVERAYLDFARSEFVRVAEAGYHKHEKQR